MPGLTVLAAGGSGPCPAVLLLKGVDVWHVSCCQKRYPADLFANTAILAVSQWFAVLMCRVTFAERGSQDVKGRQQARLLLKVPEQPGIGGPHQATSIQSPLALEYDLAAAAVHQAGEQLLSTASLVASHGQAQLQPPCSVIASLGPCISCTMSQASMQFMS